MNQQTNASGKKKWLWIIAIIVVVGLIGKAFEGEKPKQETTSAPTQEQLQKEKEKVIKNAKSEAEVNLRMYIEDKLMNPKSFDVLSQKSYQAGDSTIVVVIEYTATNAFGGTIKDNIQAEADLNGKLTKIFGGKSLK